MEFKEESDVNGDRRGSYSYIDPNGQRHTVSYTAGRNGFRVSNSQARARALRVLAFLFALSRVKIKVICFDTALIGGNYNNFPCKRVHS